MLVGSVFAEKTAWKAGNSPTQKQRRIAVFACVKEFLHDKSALVNVF